jgi:hypothetical protein
MNFEKQGIIINSGLGNQLFMLFAGISKAIDQNKKITIYLEISNRPYYFNNFFKTLNEYVSYNTNNIIYSKIYNEPYFHYNKIPENAEIIKGYYQSEKYFSHNYDKIIDMLKIKNMQEKNKLLFKSIAIHFRMGDYLQAQHINRHIILQPSYYFNALCELSNKININEYKFVIFSEKCNDEIINKYIEILNLPINFIKIYDIMPNLTEYEELLYMSNCDHFIIANSTYSWWGAYLSNNKNKIVICPNEWFGSELKHYNLCDLFPTNWIKIT